MLTVNVLSTQGVVSWLFGGETEKLSYVSCGHKKHLFWMTPHVTLLSGHTVENYSCTQYLLTKAFGLPSAKNKNVPNRNIPLLPRVALPFENKAANVLATGPLNQWTSLYYDVESGHISLEPFWFEIQPDFGLLQITVKSTPHKNKDEKVRNFGRQWYIKAQLGMNIRLLICVVNSIKLSR